MAEYIDREEYCEKHCRCSNEYCDKESCPIWKAPAADVAPVVHCKDCAYRTEMGNCGHPRHHGILPSAYPYDFCSYGVRKDDDDAEPEE